MNGSNSTMGGGHHGGFGSAIGAGATGNVNSLANELNARLDMRSKSISISRPDGVGMTVNGQTLANGLSLAGSAA